MDSSQNPLTRSDYYAQLQASALKATKSAAALPADLSFHRSVDSDIASDLEACSNILLNLASSSKSAKRKGKARDIAFDQVNARTRAPAIAINPPEPKRRRRQKHVPHLPKPQLKFKRKADNTNGVVWSPTLRHKFNARVPLGYSLAPERSQMKSSRPPHPYRYEITNLSYPARMFHSQPPIPSKPFEETPLALVSTRSQLVALIDKLRESREIAIDLEYHSYRAYNGFDWIVGPFELRDDLEDLNEGFTNPNIVKALHGAESDVVWLQQDFNLYLVNMFDTFHASKILEFPRHGLAALLRRMYCDFSADKRYQLADWRIRPLPDEMVKYARADTHCLLYINDNLRNALLDAPSPVPPLLPQPRRVYAPDPYDAEGGTGFNGWDTLAGRWNKAALGVDGVPSVQRAVFRAVHDESTGYVLSNRFPPADMAALLHAFPSAPPVVRRRAKELLEVIREAVRKGLSVPATPITPEPKEDVVVFSEPARASSTLWSGSKPLPTITTSSLFGAVSVLPRPPAAYSTSKSSLFGAPPSTNPKTKSFDRFQDVVNRIHSTLMIAPTVPKYELIVHSYYVMSFLSQVAAQKTAVMIAEVVTTPIPDVPITLGSATTEIPFVPASQRQTTNPDIVGDTIVVVGQRQKKRKRAKKAEVVPFDFESTPNILDDGAEEHEDGKVGKRKQQKRGVLDRGDFRRRQKIRGRLKAGMSRVLSARDVDDKEAFFLFSRHEISL
ncbi:ribonuclease H-like domain-containing protein [Lactarius quietus]|nr:ribonuclease H-like domain-containing protein [Lactarius quietus]